MGFRLFVLALILLGTQSLFASHSAAKRDVTPLLISDIDDTIKISHVLDWKDTAANAFRSDLYFKGMPELYSLLAQPFQYHLYYITNALKWLMAKSHQALLDWGGFPERPIFFRQRWGDGTHKLKQIRHVIDLHRPTHLILVGDNAEKDAQYYEQIKIENPELSVHQFIRAAYSPRTNAISPISSSQVAFISPIEIAMELNKSDLISDAQLMVFLTNLLPDIISELKMNPRRQREKTAVYFPEWMNCGDVFHWMWGEFENWHPDLPEYARLAQSFCE